MITDEQAGPAVTRVSLQTDLLAAHERADRLNTRIHQLEKRLSEALGEHTWRESGLGAPTDIDARVPGAQTIARAPLADSDTAALLGELLGSHLSVGDLAAVIADRACGNPFFTEEMVREFVQRGVLAGERGGYVCRADAAEVSVPATVQAAIEARIDRLNSAAKRTLNAALVIGARFGLELLAALAIDPVLEARGWPA